MGHGAWGAFPMTPNGSAQRIGAVAGARETPTICVIARRFL